MSVVRVALQRGAEMLIGAATAWAPIPVTPLAVLALVAEARMGRLLGAVGAIAVGFSAFGLAVSAPLLGLPECPATTGIDVRCVDGTVGSRVALMACLAAFGGIALAWDMRRGARSA